MDILLEKSQELKSQAENFLTYHGIEKILQKYLCIHYTGSFLYNLMCWRDIDIAFEYKDHDVKKAFNYIFSELIKKNEVIDIHYMDGVNFKTRKGLPKGYYLGFDMFDSAINDKWKVDMWFLDEEHFKDKVKFDGEMKSRLTLSKMKKIIKLKFKYMGNSNRVPSLISYHIYQAFLFKGLEKDQDIVEYINSCLNTNFKNA